MNKGSMNVIKSMATGLMAGMVVGYIGSNMVKKEKNESKISKAIHNMSDMFDKTADFFG